MAQSTVIVSPQKNLLPVPFPFSFLSSPHCPFPFLLFPYAFPSPFPFLLFPFPLSPFPIPFLIPFPLFLSPFPFPVFFSFFPPPFPFPLQTVVTYRWRNPELWFPEEKSSSLFLSLSPFSCPSSFHCPFPFLLSPSPFPFPFPAPFLLFLSLSPFSFPFAPCIDGATLKHIGNTFWHRWHGPQK